MIYKVLCIFFYVSCNYKWVKSSYPKGTNNNNNNNNKTAIPWQDESLSGNFILYPSCYKGHRSKITQWVPVVSTRMTPSCVAVSFTGVTSMVTPVPHYTLWYRSNKSEENVTLTGNWTSVTARTTSLENHSIKGMINRREITYAKQFILLLICSRF